MCSGSHEVEGEEDSETKGIKPQRRSDVRVISLHYVTDCVVLYTNCVVLYTVFVTVGTALTICDQQTSLCECEVNRLPVNKYQKQSCE